MRGPVRLLLSMPKRTAPSDKLMPGATPFVDHQTLNSLIFGPV
jgi:hypothetical protein